MLFLWIPTVELNFATMMPWNEMEEKKEEEVINFYNLSPRTEAHIEIKFGNPEDEIDSLAQKYPNPLILVGHSTKGWLEEVFSGSTAKGLAMRAHSPVLIY